MHTHPILDELADFWFAIRAQPWLTATVFGFGIATGLLVTVGLAEALVLAGAVG